MSTLQVINQTTGAIEGVLQDHELELAIQFADQRAERTGDQYKVVQLTIIYTTKPREPRHGPE